MWRWRTLKGVVGALILAPTASWSDASMPRVFLLANQPQDVLTAPRNGTYASVDEKLTDFLIAQGMQINSSLQTTKSVARFGDAALVQAIRSAGLSKNDFAITYAIVADISENAVSRVLKARAEGAIFNAGSQELLSTFSLVTPESHVLSKDKNVCPQSCVATALAGLSDELAREMSFVLAQKISFIEEDRVVTDTSDVNAIKNRLSASTAREPVRKTITTQSGNYYIDVARSINIEVYFDFDSAVLTSKAIEQITPLGEALSSPDIGSGKYLIIGHTDAKGSAAYNQTLSEKRAASVRNFLLERFPVLPSNLTSVGLGETQLKRPTEPNAGINRRVEISLLLEPMNLPAPKPVTGLNTYTLNFKRFVNTDVLKVTKALEEIHAREVDLLKSGTASRTYSIETKLSMMELEEALLTVMLSLGINVDSLRIAITGDTISVDKL